MTRRALSRLGRALARRETPAEDGWTRRRRCMHDRPNEEAAGGATIAPFFLRAAPAFGKPVCRLGLASRGGSGLRPEDVHHALGAGVNFLNWPGGDDAVSRAVGELGPRR